MSATPKPAKRSGAFTDEERAAMKERAQEMKTASRRGSRPSREDAEAELLAKIAEMTPEDRAIAERIHAIVQAAAPDLMPKLWYGMPGYAKDGQLVCFFQPAAKFKARYATLGFNDPAKLDEGNMWPTAYALTKVTAADEKRIGELIKKAAS